MELINQFTDEQRTKYYHVVGEGDLDSFLKKYKPSLIEMRDAPWIWCGDGKGDSEGHAVAVSKGADIRGLPPQGIELMAVEDLVDQLKVIENDSTIPVRAKKGQKSKKVVRDEATAEATAALKELSLKSGYTNGKWLLYPAHESVDAVWARVARSVEKGPLRAAGVNIAKVATTDNPESSHVICVYYDSVYDKDKTEKVLRALLNHGLEPSAVKSDLYTVIGLDSKHPSKMRSSIWRPVDFMSKDDVKAFKESWNKEKEKELYAGLEDSKPKEEEAKAEPANSRRSRPTAPVKRDLELPSGPKPKRIKSKARAFRDEDVFAGSEDD